MLVLCLLLLAPGFLIHFFLIFFLFMTCRHQHIFYFESFLIRVDLSRSDLDLLVMLQRWKCLASINCLLFLYPQTSALESSPRNPSPMVQNGEKGECIG